MFLKYFPHVLGGQRILAVDLPRPPASKEQQGSLLSAAVEAQTPHPAQRRPNQGHSSISMAKIFSQICSFYKLPQIAVSALAKLLLC